MRSVSSGPIIAKLTGLIHRRVDVAYRWFRLRDKAAVQQFVQDDPDVQAYLANPLIANVVDRQDRQARLAVIAEIIDGVDIAKHRQQFGDEFVDHVLEVSAKLDGKEVQ